jgi:hypothetical protein
MDNELDNPTKINEVPRTTEEILKTINEIPSDTERLKKFVTQKLIKIEQEAWDHELQAEYTEQVAIPPVTQLIDQNRIAIARHQEIIQEIANSNSKTREDKERRKASEQDIRELEKENHQRNQFKQQLQKIADGRRAQATESRLHLQFIATKHKALFEKQFEPERED